MGMATSGAQQAPYSNPYQTPYQLPGATSWTNQGTTAQVQGGTAFANPPSQPPQLGMPMDDTIQMGGAIGQPQVTNPFGGMPGLGNPPQDYQSIGGYGMSGQGGLSGQLDMLDQPPTQYTPGQDTGLGRPPFLGLPGPDIMPMPILPISGQFPNPGVPQIQPRPIMTQPPQVQQPVGQPVNRPNPFVRPQAPRGVVAGRVPQSMPRTPGRTDRPRAQPVQLKPNPFLRTR